MSRLPLPPLVNSLKFFRGLRNPCHGVPGVPLVASEVGLTDFFGMGSFGRFWWEIDTDEGSLARVTWDESLYILCPGRAFRRVPVTVARSGDPGTVWYRNPGPEPLRSTRSAE